MSDIIFDFSVKPRLANERGNAILVASSIYEACKYFALFRKTLFKGRCAVVTSYNPLARDVTLEDTGANTETDKEFIYNTYNGLLKEVDAKPSCNPVAGSIRLNTDLAKKPRECLEYIVVHELIHLREPTHSARFVALMDQYMPKWQFYRDQLNRLPVSHEDWVY